jgi:glycosyltransferase involved in cell wall biosynthesis
MGEALGYHAPIRVGSHHYADQFLNNGHQVFWLSWPVHFTSLVGAVIGREASRRTLGYWRQGVVEERDRLWSYHPLTFLPVRNNRCLSSPVIVRNTLAWTWPGLRSVLRRHGFEQLELLWLSQSPSALSLSNQVRARRLVYRISDDYTSFSGVPTSLAQAEVELVDRADVVFATAHRLLERALSLGAKNAHYLPNGVDFEHFQQPEGESPRDLADLPRPRAIYVGTVGDWFDDGWVSYAAHALPGWTFVLIGPAHRDLSALEAQRNVRVLGPRAYADLPAYLKAADVAMIPFKKNALTEATNPVKLFEYLAAGLPVVSTRLDEIEQLASPAVLAGDAEEFATCLEDTLHHPPPKEACLEFARHHRWEERYHRIQAICGI